MKLSAYREQNQNNQHSRKNLCYK